MDLKEISQQPTFEFRWVAGDGGPLILMEERLLPYWEGSDAPSGGRGVEAESRWGLNVATDYDAACDVNDWAGVIQVDSGSALVVSTEHNATTWIPALENGDCALVEWVFANSEAEILALANELVSKGEFSVTNELNFMTSPAVLFVAAERGSVDVYERLKIEIPTGSYKVLTGHRQTETASVVCHIFRLNEQL